MRRNWFKSVLCLTVFGLLNVVSTLYSVPPDDKGAKFVTVCHKGSTLRVNENALKAHLDHGDSMGSCEVTPGSNK